ncbi:MAG: hypothetical protein CSA23_07825 [Deltaproteobacteria bacterium]|nr:MAG: hypothetical protein CSA23_07825 [Deltaproteobacteria bacterium]
MKSFIIMLVFFFIILPVQVHAEDTEFTSFHFAGSGTCIRCHNGLSDPGGNDLSIEKAWNSTMMANAAKDPFWRAKVRSEINRNPHLEAVINDKCTKCHAPMANKEATYYGHAVEFFGNGFLNPANSHHDEALNGVSCTLCHQIRNSSGLGTLAGMSGQYEIDDSRTIYAQYSDVATGPMINNVDYMITYGAHTSDSKMCATCHNLKTPFVDENGNLLSTTPESEFPEQMPYSEWEHSSYVATHSCQDCHMPHYDGVRIARRPPWANTLRNGFAHHMFSGGNNLMVDILDNNRDALDVTSNNFGAVLAANGEMLNSAASVAVENHAYSGGVLDLTVRVNSLTGHKLPTSFPSRRVFLHLTVSDSEGNPVFESGRTNADGSIVGADSDIDPATYEPHYACITAPDQVQIYEAVMGDNLNQVTYTLLRAMTYKKDNRLLPSGFDKNTAHSDVQVHGNALSDTDFTGGGDSISYQIGGLEHGEVYTITVELLYQTLAHAFSGDLFTDPSDEAAAFETMVGAATMKTSQIAETTLQIDTGTFPAACNDGLDNDEDGYVDLDDPGCSDENDDNEYNASPPAVPAMPRAGGGLIILVLTLLGVVRLRRTNT